MVMTPEIEVPIPLSVRLLLGRAAAQTLADEASADLLHIKGNAADPLLRSSGDFSTDIDVLVRPGDVARFDGVLRAHGWRVYSTFTLGSPFGHAQTYIHDVWGYLDVHRYFPGVGIDPPLAFERLWSDRSSIDVAGVACAVPSLPAQATLLALNAARSQGRGIDLVWKWTEANDNHRAQVLSIVDDLSADVAFAAASGDLELFRRARDYRLWKVASRGGTRAEEWWARIRAERSFIAALRVASRAPLVNREQLAHTLGRAPTRREVATAFFARPRRLFAEAWGRAVGSRGSH
jgi:hypothetical protein